MTTPDDKLPDVWVSRHGGEPVALLAVCIGLVLLPELARLQ